ncbi:hypothetical protein E1A91_D08G270000v1, partial [Gossypium mustelinum]
PLEERMCMTNVQTRDSIPIIDMSNPDDPEIVNHDVPAEVLENVKDATYKFFGLPAEVRNKYSKELSSSNNVRFGTSFTPQAEKALEWKNYLSLIIVDGVDEANLNYYPKCPNPELTVGVDRHSDASTLTILLQGEIGGLFVRGNDGDNWIHVPPIKGSLVINVGDALQIISNGKYRSVKHRVVANGSKNRISVPIFVNPRPIDMIGPFPELIENDYVKHFFCKAHDGKKTVVFAEL